uniref:Uncharacterized protein n=1 Tax=Echeneis naucrates TaxID=173247 RepID=A0A665X406_ECHNA
MDIYLRHTCRLAVNHIIFLPPLSPEGQFTINFNLERLGPCWPRPSSHVQPLVPCPPFFSCVHLVSIFILSHG